MTSFEDAVLLAAFPTNKRTSSHSKETPLPDLFAPSAYGIAEVELIYKAKPETARSPVIRSSSDAYAVLLHAWDENKIDFVEQFQVLLLNHGNRVLGIYPMSTGGVASTVVDPKLCFVAALKANASSIILAHNHPSMNMEPSAHDKALTKKLEEAGRFLEVKVLDHLIICRNGYYSISDEEFTLIGYTKQPEPSRASKNSLEV